MMTLSETRRSPSAAPAAALATAGFAALCTQVLLMRELMVAWRGNEMSLGIALFVWLAATGAGGFLYARLGRRLAGRDRLAAWVAALGILSPLSLAVARLTRLALGVPAGELVGFSALLLGAVVSIAPFAVVGGLVFAMAISAMTSSGRPGVDAVGSAYVVEAVGSVLAGVAMSFLLLRFLDAFSIVFLSTALCASAALRLALPVARGRAAHPSGHEHAPGTPLPEPRRASPERAGMVTVAVCACLLGAAVMALAAGWGRALDDATVAAQWRELGFRSQANSIYGRIVTAELGSQKSVYESGVLAASEPDRMSAEETVHFAMLQHPAPGRVLLVGRCLGGAVAEILKHPSVDSVDCVELDQALILEARRQFGEDMTAGLDDPRVTLHYGDARLFVKNAGAAQGAGAYDVAIVGVPDPTTARLNRFYTLGFARELRACMAGGGVAGLALSSAENYVSDELAELLSCIERTFDEAFGQVLLTPGDPCHILAAVGESLLTADPDSLSARVASRNLDVAYVRDYYLNDRLSYQRRTAFERVVETSTPGLNTDLAPRGYYLSLVLWDRQLHAGRGLIAAARSLLGLRNAIFVAAAVAALGAALASRRRRTPEAMVAPVYISVFVVGLTEISLEIAALSGFQSLYGYVYNQVALIVAAFMAGLVVGGRLGISAVRRGWGLGGFVLLQAGMALVPLGLWGAVAWISELPPSALAAWSHAFPVLVVAAAVLAGIQFPLAAKLCPASRTEPGAAGGRLHGMDLTGAAVGAPLTAVFLLPVLGLRDAMVALAVINCGALAALMISAAFLPRRR